MNRGLHTKIYKIMPSLKLWEGTMLLDHLFFEKMNTENIFEDGKFNSLVKVVSNNE